MVPDHPHGAEDLRGAAPSVLPAFVGPVSLGVVAVQPEIVLGDQLLPALGFRKEEIRQPPLEVEVGFDEGLSGLAALDLQFLYAEGSVHGLHAVGAEDPAPVGDDSLRGTVKIYGGVQH